MSFFISRSGMFPVSEPLRLPMERGAQLGGMPSTESRVEYTQTPADAAQAGVPTQPPVGKPEYEINVTMHARVLHIIDSDTELYKTTHIELEAIASVTVDHLKLKVGHIEIVCKDLWQYTAWGDVKELERVINDLRAAIKAKAENLLTGRERVEKVLKENGINLLVERTVYDDEYYDDDDDDDDEWGDC